MKSRQGPYPSPGFPGMLASNVMAPQVDSWSGEITASRYGDPLGAVGMHGRISDVWLSVIASGKDDASTLSLEAVVYINGVSAMTTNPKIAHVSGEASTQKTTKETGDTGITQAVMNGSANTVAPGDVLTYDFLLTRTASPTTEMKHPVIVVEFDPTA